MTDFVKYQPKTWVSREFIKKNDMNHLETGVENNSEAIESLFNSKIDGWFIEDNVLYFTANGEVVGNGGVKIVQNALTPYQFDIQETDLIKHLQDTLIDLNNSTATAVGEYQFSSSSLQTVKVAAQSVGTGAFDTCVNLTVIDLTYTGAVTIAANAFSRCKQLTHVIIRSNSVASLAATDAFYNTKIANGVGGIYVPSTLLTNYKSATNWSTYADHIYPIEEYPKTDFGTITDSWADIKTHMNAGDYNTRYKVGDTKLLTLNDADHTQVHMQIAAFDADTMSNNNKAKITWLCKNIYSNHRMNATATAVGGWEDTEMRSWLNESVLSYIPSDVSSNIVEVKKSSYNGETTVDKLWIPSNQEVNFSSNKETNGVTYSGLFPTTTNSNNANRVKYDNFGDSSEWWLRSAYSNSLFYHVGNSGHMVYFDSSTHSYGVVFGFCMS